MVVCLNLFQLLAVFSTLFVFFLTLIRHANTLDISACSSCRISVAVATVTFFVVPLSSSSYYSYNIYFIVQFKLSKLNFMSGCKLLAMR